MTHLDQNLPPVQLEFFRIVDIQLSELPDSEHSDIAVELDCSPIQTQSKEREQLGLEVELFINKRRRNVQIRGYIKSIAFFEFEKDLSQNEKVHFLLGNGFAMIYSLLRGVVYQKVSTIHPDHRLLPTLNLTLIAQKKMNSLGNDSANEAAISDG